MRFNFSEFAWGKAIFLVFVLILLADITLLNIKVFKREAGSKVVPTEKLEEVSEIVSGEVNFCPVACLETITEATAASLIQPAPVSLISSGGKEFNISLGQGSTKSTTWVELMGAEAVIDMANYPKAKSIVFEASMRIPTANGRAYAKLYNVTDKHDAWNSEVYAEGSSGYRAEANDVILASGRKLYRVMLKSTMGYEVILDSARVKIILN